MIYQDAEILIDKKERVFIRLPHSKIRVRTVFYRKNFKGKDWDKMITLAENVQLIIDACGKVEKPVEKSEKSLVAKLFRL